MPCPTCTISWLLAAAAFWLALAVIGWWAERTPPSPRPDIATGLAAWLIRTYLRLVHGMKVEGKEHLAAAIELHRAGRGLVVTANHAAGIDPLLVQSAVPFFVRWLAAADTVSPTVQPFVEFAEVIFVNSAGEGGNELHGVRQAIRYLQGDPSNRLTKGKPGVLGLFPEGRIARRPGVITPFQPGIGLMIGKSRALVLPIVIKGVPIRDNTYQSFIVPSRSTVTFMAPIDYSAMGVKSGAIAGELQGRYAEWVGPVVPPQGRARK